MNPIFIRGGAVVYCILIAALTLVFCFHWWPQLLTHVFDNWPKKKDIGLEIAFSLLGLYGIGGYLALGGWHILRVLKRRVFRRDPR